MLAIFATYKPQTRIFDDFSLSDEQEHHRKQQAELRQKRALFKKSVESGEWAANRKVQRGQPLNFGRGRGGGRRIPGANHFQPHQFAYEP